MHPATAVWKNILTKKVLCHYTDVHKFPHLTFYLLSLGIGYQQLINEMEKKSIPYKSPMSEIIEIEVETALLFTSGSNVENPVDGEEIDW